MDQAKIVEKGASKPVTGVERGAPERDCIAVGGGSICGGGGIRGPEKPGGYGNPKPDSGPHGFAERFTIAVTLDVGVASE